MESRYAAPSIDASLKIEVTPSDVIRRRRCSRSFSPLPRMPWTSPQAQDRMRNVPRSDPLRLPIRSCPQSLARVAGSPLPAALRSSRPRCSGGCVARHFYRVGPAAPPWGQTLAEWQRGSEPVAPMWHGHLRFGGSYPGSLGTANRERPCGATFSPLLDVSRDRRIQIRFPLALPRMRRPQRTPRQLGGAQRSSSSAIGGVLRGRCVLPRLESGHRGFLQEALA